MGFAPATLYVPDGSTKAYGPNDAAMAELSGCALI